MAAFSVCSSRVVAPRATIKVSARATAAKMPVMLRRPAFNPAVFGRSSVSGTRARTMFMVRAADSDKLQSELSQAIKEAQECTDDCAVEWDSVEELSAAVGDTKKSETTTEPAPLDPMMVEAMAAVQAALKDAESKVDATADATAALVEAKASLVEVQNKTPNSGNSERLAKLEMALSKALEMAQACTDDCAPDWDAVEEISAAMDKAKK